jgi:hypothetical protein
MANAQRATTTTTMGTAQRRNGQRS